MIDKTKAIQSLRPNAEFLVRGETVEWHDKKQSKPTDSEIDAEITRLQAEYDANQYQRDRVYPSIQDQLDMQYWDKVKGTTTWQDAIAKVKADTPKPGE
jgi:hypothetical protein|tara:strand:+ start:1267 stop:1563 length:297 start_codon:yes stop_codon:yes gene_type:complete